MNRHLKPLLVVVLFMQALFCAAQNSQHVEVVVDSIKQDAKNLNETPVILDSLGQHSTNTLAKPTLVDGVVAVVGEYVILGSDIDKAYIDLESQGVRKESFGNCKILAKLMEDKLYAHNGIQDSIKVGESEIKDYVNRQIEFLLEQVNNDMDKLLKLYNKEDEKSLRQDMFKVNRINQLSSRMQAKIVDAVEITPEEIRMFYKKVMNAEDPLMFGADVEISQIVIEPEVSKEEEEVIVERLLKIREDVLNNGASFASKALLYSEDPGSRSRGGYYAMNKKTPMVKEFKDAVFSLEEREVSEPFKSDFGWHIVTVDKIRGQERDVRHILLIPKASPRAFREAKEKVDLIRKRIADKETTFETAAREFSTEKETKLSGGRLINPETMDTHFELTKIDPTLYNQIKGLKEGEMSIPFLEQGQSGKSTYKILKVISKTKEHQADFNKDYTKIKDLALKEKKIRTIEKWMKEKTQNTHVYVREDYKTCDFITHWIKD